MILGSGALKIGQAGEFDYSGSQAIKALKEEGIKTVLVNPNIATIQTSEEFADNIYFLPVNCEFVEKIIAKERPDAVLLGFGGQTALNCGLALERKAVFKKYQVKVLGTSIAAIEQTESRRLFAKHIKNLGLNIPKSNTAHDLKSALKSAKKIGYPVMCRGGFSLGGQGSNIARNEKELRTIVPRALSFTPELLVEEYLYGFKELEYEVVRDQADNCLIICNMENLDPMGVHTGESIVVAPSQTLNNEEYYLLRRLAIKVIRHFKIVGECNIQFALDPKKLDYRIIEVNARLSRSSALASKVTGYPLAFIAAKLAIGYNLDQLKNNITQKTSAFFEPSLDYLAIKIPRWDFEKFGREFQAIGTEMQSVGEVMAIGRNFPEVIQKANRMLNQGLEGVIDQRINYTAKKIKKIIKSPNSKRLSQICHALLKGILPSQISKITKIDAWFIHELKKITDFYQTLQDQQDDVWGTPDGTPDVVLRGKNTKRTLLKEAKLLGFSDNQIAEILKTDPGKIREERRKQQILPCVKQIDTLAAEYPAQTNYLYLTYQGRTDDLEFKEKSQVMVLASGPYCIGSSVEFDWCAVNTVNTLRKEGFPTILVNCNPETVSTDYDITDKLYFEELTLERILDIGKKEHLSGIIVSVGGQIPNNLSLPLTENGLKILGTDAASIDTCEDRKKFSCLLNSLNINQPFWQRLDNTQEALKFADKIGFPVIARPSYVLSGKAMYVAHNSNGLRNYLKKNDGDGQNIVISKFIENAKEIEADFVARHGKILLCAVSEHIENAGVHSGDASIVFPPQRVYLETIRKIKKACQEISQALKITGPANIQFLAKDNQIMVIECNLRASRTFPFISKMCDHNLIEIATKTIIGKKTAATGQTHFLDADFVGVKVPQFSFSRLKNVDPVLRVEMASTGEVACLGNDIEEAYLKAIIATDQRLPQKTVLISLGGEENKIRFLDEARLLHQIGLIIFATRKTCEFLNKNGVPATLLYKIFEKTEPNIITHLTEKKLDLVININDQGYFPQNHIEDDYKIRRNTVDFGIPLITNLQAAKLFVQSLSLKKNSDLRVRSYKSYLKKII